MNYITENGNLNDEGFEILRNMATTNGYVNDDRIDKIEKILFERSELISQFNLNPELSSSDKKVLEDEINRLSKELEELGVSDTVPEEMQKSLYDQLYSHDIGVMAIPPVNYFDFYKDIFNISAYESSYTYNGKSYRFYSINLEDKPGSKRYLSRIYYPTIIVKGSLYDINALNRYVASAIVYAASKGTARIKNEYVRTGIDKILSFIPDSIKPNYLIHGSNVHLIPTIRVMEQIRYIYVYDQNSDQWILSGAGSYAKTIVDNLIYYRPSSNIESIYRQDTNYIYGNYNLLYQEAIAWYDLQKDLGIYFEPLDGVLKEIEIDYEENSKQRIYTINLCGDKYPGNIVLY